ncbi:hypothetical protein WMW72_25100 [Paenibacillus filicis]|uniref:Secreted protein n=1 Tax=Paenibacillus filicis TaxID=669464 RepID=A0ABU9DTY3_9BACL
MPMLMEWSIDMPLILLMLGFTVWAAVPWIEAAGYSGVYAVRSSGSSCTLVLKTCERPHKTEHIVLIRRKRPPRSSENSDQPALLSAAGRH